MCKLAPFASCSLGNVPRASAEIGINVKITPTPGRIFGIETYKKETAKFTFVYINVASPKKKNPIAIKTRLSSDFAADYFNLIKADKFLEIQEQLVENQQAIVAMVQDKYQIGLCSLNELLAEEKFLTSLKEERNRHKLTREVLEESLKVYLVNYDEDVPRSNYEQVTLLENIPEEYSSAIVEHRPDFK